MKRWTKDDVIFLKDNYKEMSNRELSERLGKTYKSVDSKMRRIGIKRNNDLSNSRFGKLIVLGPTKKRIGNKIVWHCICDCGKEKFVQTDSLKGGLTKSCGCIQKEFASKNGKKRKSNYVGEKFGNLIVIKDSGKRRDSQIIWECLCKCGNKKMAVSYQLKIGVTRSCGIGSCYHAYNPLLTDEERIINRDVTENLHWRTEVFERDGYKCSICGDDRGGNLNAHHLNSWGAFPEERFHISNGRTLCHPCHLDFHKEYGYKNNTKKQFEEYMKSKKVML